MIGSSHAFLQAQRALERMAPCEAPILIEGETGTGKELAARALHYGSARRAMPFLPVNCGAIPDSLIESELFGHKRGAFTDAREDRPGLVALADGGTLFLDEIDSLSTKAQVVLLRFLQDREYRPVGGRGTKRADVRILAATNSDLSDLARTGRFRADLLYRVKVLTLSLPPLRERDEDCLLLAQHFLEQASEREGRPARMLDGPSQRWLLEYAWPGNVRELESLIYRETLLSESLTLRLSGAEASESASPRSTPWSLLRSFRHARALALGEFERRYLMQVLAESRGNVTKAARLAGKERRALGKLIKKHGIDCRRFS